MSKTYVITTICQQYAVIQAEDDDDAYAQADRVPLPEGWNLCNSHAIEVPTAPEPEADKPTLIQLVK